MGNFTEKQAQRGFGSTFNAMPTARLQQ